MPQSNNIALKVFSQAFNGKDIETVFNQLVSSISKETKKTEKEVIDQINNNLSFSKELQDKIISEFEKAEKSLGGKSFTFSKDLFKGIFDTNGIEEEINKVVKTFENNIESLINLKNRIGDDKVFFSMDTSQLDEAIKKEQQLIELIEKRNSLEKGDRSKTGITRNINNLEKELNSYISNLRSSSSNLSGQINVPTIDEKDLKLINNTPLQEVGRKLQGVININKKANNGKMVEVNCGTGAMILAYASTLKMFKLNYKFDLEVTAIDTDIINVFMTYIQLYFFEISAVVILVDEKTNKELMRLYTPFNKYDMENLMVA